MRLPAEGDVCWIDGRRAAAREAVVPIDDPALQSGMGLFETVAVEGAALLDLDAHLDRLFAGLDRLGIDGPPREELRATALLALEGAAACGWMKILVTGAGRWFVYRGAIDPAEAGRTVTAVLLPWRRNPQDPLSGLKTLNYAANRIGLERARSRGADEGLWLNHRGHLTEGCASNLFVIHGRALYTASTRDGILPGVVRGLVLDAARRLGLAIHEGKLRRKRLEGGREAFLTSSLRGLRPLVRFEGRPVGGGTPGPLTARLAAEVARCRDRVGADGRHRPAGAVDGTA